MVELRKQCVYREVPKYAVDSSIMPMKEIIKIQDRQGK